MTQPASYSLGINKSQYDQQIQLVENNHLTSLKINTTTGLLEKMDAPNLKAEDEVVKQAVRLILVGIDSGFVSVAQRERPRIPPELNKVALKCQAIFKGIELKDIPSFKGSIGTQLKKEYESTGWFGKKSVEQILNEGTSDELKTVITTNESARAQALVQFLKKTPGYEISREKDAKFKTLLLTTLQQLVEERDIHFVINLLALHPSILKDDKAQTITESFIKRLNKLPLIKKEPMRKVVNILKEAKIPDRLKLGEGETGKQVGKEKSTWIFVKRYFAQVKEKSDFQNFLIRSGFKITIKEDSPKNNLMRVITQLQTMESSEEKTESINTLCHQVAKLKVLELARFELAQKEIEYLSLEAIKEYDYDDVLDMNESLSDETVDALNRLDDYEDLDISDDVKIKDVNVALRRIKHHLPDALRTNEYLSDWHGVAGSGRQASGGIFAYLGYKDDSAVSWCFKWVKRMNFCKGINAKEEDIVSEILAGKTLSEIREKFNPSEAVKEEIAPVVAKTSDLDRAFAQLKVVEVPVVVPTPAPAAPRVQAVAQRANDFGAQLLLQMKGKMSEWNGQKALNFEGKVYHPQIGEPMAGQYQTVKPRIDAVWFNNGKCAVITEEEQAIVQFDKTYRVIKY